MKCALIADVMIIEHSKDKNVKCYMAFVEDPTNPKKMRAFCKSFNASLVSEAVQLHNRLVESPNAAHYNRVFGKPKNCIEIKQGTRDKDPQILNYKTPM